MDFFKRIWAFVSPTKTHKQPLASSATLSAEKHAGRTRKASLRDITRDTRSMSPTERVGIWNDTSLGSAAIGQKRKRPLTPTTSGVGHSKFRRMDNMGMSLPADNMEVDDEDAYGAEDAHMSDRDDASELTSLVSDLHVRSPREPITPTSPNEFLYDSDSSIDIDETSVVDDGAYHSTPKRRKIVTLPAEQEALGVSSTSLHEDGWPDDHITLVQKIRLRGHEPLLPKHWHFGFRFMPDALFTEDDTSAFICSLHNAHFPAEKAFEKLLDLGSRIRDADRPESHTRPEAHVGKTLHAYMKWALKDARLDMNTCIPILALEVHPEGTSYEDMQGSAIENLEHLASRYRTTFRATPSTELSSVASPRSDSTQLSHQVPQLYTLMASKTIVAISAYRPGEGLIPVAVFDFSQVNFDVWNSIALAVVVCHARNVMVDVAEETGLGWAMPGSGRDMTEDMDL